MKKFCLWAVVLSLMLTLGACGNMDNATVRPSASPSTSPSATVSPSENPGSVTDQDGFVDNDDQTDRENSVTEDDRNGQDSDRDSQNNGLGDDMDSGLDDAVGGNDSTHENTQP
jgi:hypothetical protein